MASSKDLKIIQQAKKEYAAAQQRGDELGMAAAHRKADQARGFTTTTKMDNKGNYYQSVASAAPPITPTPSIKPSTFRSAPAPAPVTSPADAARAKVRNSATTALTTNLARRGLPVTTKIDPAIQERNTAKLLEELKGPQGGIASGIAGGVTGFVGAGKRQMAPEVQQTIESSPGLNRAFTGGQIAGTMAQFAIPYAAASKPIAALPKVANVGTRIGRGLSTLAPKLGEETAQRIGRGIAGSVATDLAIGLPLNVNMAVNQEGLRGADAAKNIAFNTGLDLATGGLIEAAPMAVKAFKGIQNRIPVVQPGGKISYVSASTTPARNTVPASAPKIVPKWQKEVSSVVAPGEIASPVDSFKQKFRAQIAPQNRAIQTPASASDVAVQTRNENLGAMAPVSQLTGDEFKKGEKNLLQQVGDFFNGIGNKVNRPGFGDIDLNSQGVRSSIAHGIGRNKAITFKAVPDVLKNGQILDHQLNWKGRGYDTYVIAAPVKIANDPYYVGAVVIKDSKSNRYYLHEVVQEKAEGDIMPFKTGGDDNISYPSGNNSPSVINLLRKALNVNTPEKIIEAAAPNFNNQNVAKLDSKFKSLGANTARAEKTIDELVKEYGAFPKGEPPRAREIDVPKKTDYGDVQQHVRTLQESGVVDDTLSKGIEDELESFTKANKGNRIAVENANSILKDDGIDSAFDRLRSVLRSDKQPKSDDIALGYRVMQELQKEGRYGDALDAAIDLSEMLSETGRTLQAARIAKRLSPEGRLMVASRAADKVAKKTGNKVKLSDETVKLISDAKTEKEVVEANQKAAKEIWDQVPANWMDKVNSWRYMAMLMNPKTHFRNVVGNALFVPAREFKNLIGAGLESRLIKGGERTKAVLNPIKDKEILDFARNDFGNVKSILKNEGKIDDSVRTLDAKVFDTRALDAARKLNMNALDAEDTWFMKFAYDSSLAQYMKANGIKPTDMVGDVLEKGRAYAMNEALKATYRDFNSLANLISRGKAAAASGKYGTLGRIGGVALEGAIPFAKTPMNIIKRGVGYSPANLVRGVVNLGRVKSGKVTATEAIDQLASGLSGSALLGLGALLGYNGLVTGKEGEYKDKLYNYNQMLGSQNYSLNVGGKSYTLDWAAPLSMPFFVGVELSKAIKDNNADPAAVLDAMTQISDPMINMSMLKGINDIVTNNFEGLGQTAMDIGMGYAGQFNPTVGGQIARTLDGTRRSTISTAETQTERAIEKFSRKQLAKVPGASDKLEPYVDLWGREQKSGNILENFLSPGYFKQSNITPVDKELRSLMKGLDEESVKKILPTSTAYQYTLTADKQTYRMTERESTKYQKIRGEESYKGLQELFSSTEYRSMDSDEKVKAIEEVYSNAHDKAKMEILSTKGVSRTVLLSKSQQGKYEKYGKSLGLDEKKFVNLMKGVGSIEGEKRNGKTIDGSVSRNKKKYIDSQFPNATKEQKWFLYAMADVSGEIGHYGNYKKQFDKKE